MRYALSPDAWPTADLEEVGTERHLWTGRPALDLEDDLTLVIIEVPASRPDPARAA